MGNVSVSTEDASESNILTDAFVILDVGHGNSAVLLDSGHVVVFDTGPRSILLEFLREHSITHVDTVLLSHADSDHIGGLSALLSSDMITIGKVRANTDSLKGSKEWDDIAYELSRNDDIDFQPILTVDNTGEFDTSHVSIKIEAPTSYLASRGAGSTDRNGRHLDINSMSAVVRLIYKDVPFALLPGDMDWIGLNNILEDERDISANMIIFPHHGGRPGTSRFEDFVKSLIGTVEPSTVLFSIGRGRYGTPRPEIIKAILTHFPKTRIACTQLSEHCAKTPPTSNVNSHLSSLHAQGKSSHSCCAGTIIYYFRKGVFHPEQGTHARFVRKFTDSPLCKIETLSPSSNE